jgi:hypothetical protein
LLFPPFNPSNKVARYIPYIRSTRRRRRTFADSNVSRPLFGISLRPLIPLGSLVYNINTRTSISPLHYTSYIHLSNILHTMSANLVPNYSSGSNFASEATTPALSATSSRDSPTSVIRSPDIPAQPSGWTLGSVQEQQSAKEHNLPECWGHRGVRSYPFPSPHSLFPTLLSPTYT